MAWQARPARSWFWGTEMATGIQIINDWGTLQIDETYRNLFLRTKGTGGSIPATGADLVALQSSSYDGADNGGADSVPSTTKWWIFNLLGTAGAGTYGLKIWDASGNLVFDCFQQPMRIVDFITVAGGAAAGSKSYPSGKQYAVIRGTFDNKVLKESVPNSTGKLFTNTTTHYRMGAKVVGSTVYWDWYVWYVDGPWPNEDQSIGNGWTYSDYPTTFIVVDVTNY